MRITIDFIDHAQQRYNTVGDWQFTETGDLNMKISILPDNGLPGSYLIAIHELIEALLCQVHGVTTEEVDKFDLNFKNKDMEPGDHLASPYYQEHQIATGCERILALPMDINWVTYEDEIQWLTDTYKEKT